MMTQNFVKNFVTLVAVVYLLGFDIALAAAPTGRLFSTPAERAKLDNLRLTTRLPSPEELLDDKNEEVSIAPAMPGSVSVQGYVTRSDGKKGTVWVNDNPVQENDEAGDVRVKKLPQNGNQVQISIPSIGRDLKLKAGQVYMPETDSISEDKARASNNPANETGDDSNSGMIN
ncbi:MAG: hypothetical protein CVU35_02090 [Betaproteobacteria bacterium HGW-Betaproteobacteria-8]|nr:MAG: hypothetical protein CVU35_02090 [Betaproteobacteria bacterium HGW-Betaproteobacteria-8]